MPVPRAAAPPVREEQVRPRMALRELATDRPAAGPAAASRRDAAVVLFLAGPAVNASGAVQVIEPCRVHGAPPVTWIMRPLPIHLPFNRAQKRGVPGLAFGQQLAHVRPVVPGPVAADPVGPAVVGSSPVGPGPVGPSLNVSAHKTSPVMTLPSVASASVRVASRDDRTRSRSPASRQAPESGYRVAGMTGSGHPYQTAGRWRRRRGRRGRRGRRVARSAQSACRRGGPTEISVDTAKRLTHTFDSNFQKDVTAEGM